MLRNDTPALRRAWHPVLEVGQLGDGLQRVELLGEGYVLGRVDGEIVAFPDRCPHRNARLSDGVIVNAPAGPSAQGTRQHIQCPYHGWEFDGTGKCSFIPALGPGAAVPPTSQLAQARVRVRYGLVWIAPEEPVCGILDIPEFDDPDLQVMWLPCADIHATAGQFIDNFLDFGHFPFVHAGTFGAGEDAGISPYEVQVSADGWSFVVEYPHTIKNNEDPLVATGEHPLVQPRNMRYVFGTPFIASLRLELPLTGMTNVLAIFLQPLDADRSRLYCAMVRNDCQSAADRQAAIDYELAVLAEDLRIIENLWDNEIPLDTGASADGTVPPQTHTRADRNTVEFRRIMKRLLSLSPQA